jgi:hypothetical protein
MSVAEIPPPRRFLVETGTDDDGCETATLVECTGEPAFIYMMGFESPWAGLSLETIEQYAIAGDYGINGSEVLRQIANVRKGGTCPKSED